MCSASFAGFYRSIANLCCHAVLVLRDVVRTSLLKAVVDPSPVAKVEIMGPVCSSSLFFFLHTSLSCFFTNGHTWGWEFCEEQQEYNDDILEL